jgi:fatty-acyl-CoA synthase
MADQQWGGTAGGHILRALARYPDRVAFVDDFRSLTYAQSADLLARFQHVLMAAGAKPGDGIALLSANRAENYLAMAAAYLCGLRYTPLHPLGSLEDHLGILEDAEARFLIVDAANYAERGRAIAGRADGLSAILTFGPADFGIDMVAAAGEIGEVSASDLATPDMPATLNYTGGTTGRPKGVVRSQAGNLAIAASSVASFEFPDRPSFLATTPISHVAGTKILPTLMLGGTVYMQGHFDPEAFFAIVAKHRISATLLVPTMIYVLLDHPALSRSDLSSLELMLYGASPMSPTRLVEALEKFGPVFSQLYGQTECYPISALAKADHSAKDPDRLLSCGVPVTNCAVRLLDEEDNEVTAGEAGEICVRAPQAMDGYWKREEETAKTLSGGWLHTGDVARWDDRGYLYIVDRKKDMIVSGGFNVFPREVEDVLTGHPDVAMAAVIGVPDEKWGEAVKAVIVPRAGAKIDTEALRQLVREKKGAIYAPKTLDIAEAIPLTPIGKPDKKALRAKYWGSGRQVG